jgi:hypothetical protein
MPGSASSIGRARLVIAQFVVGQPHLLFAFGR